MNKLTMVDILTFLLLISFISISLGIWYDYNHTQEKIQSNAADMTSHTKAVIDSTGKSSSIVTKKFKDMEQAWIKDYIKTALDGRHFANVYISGASALMFASLCFSNRRKYETSFLGSLFKFIFNMH